MIPRATVHRWRPYGEVKAYCIEANSHISPPKRYLSRYGQFLEHSPYCERDLHPPTEPLLFEDGDPTSRSTPSTAATARAASSGRS